MVAYKSTSYFHLTPNPNKKQSQLVYIEFLTGERNNMEKKCSLTQLSFNWTKKHLQNGEFLLVKEGSYHLNSKPTTLKWGQTKGAQKEDKHMTYYCRRLTYICFQL